MGSISPVSPVTQLSDEIAVTSKILTEYFQSNGLPEPSFDRYAPVNVLPSSAPKKVLDARASLAEAAFKLFQLATGPSELLPNLTANYQTIFALRWLCHFNIFSSVPLEGSISYYEVASAATVSVSQLKSITRMAMTSSILQEPKTNYIAHTATSAMLVENPNFMDWATFMFDASIPTAAKMVEASEKWYDSVQKNETAYNLAFNHDLPFFDHLSQNAKLTKEFSGYMNSVTDNEGTNLKHLVNGFDWRSLPKGALVIDVGGSTGHGTFALAEAYPELQFEVQDLTPVVENGAELLKSQDEPIGSRVSFRPHNFFDAEPVKEADVYLLRMILHDWPDNEAVTILKNIIPALAPKSKLLIMDTVLPAPGEIPATKERLLRVRDLTMRQVFNSKERTLDDWETIFRVADSRLRVRRVTQPFGSNMSLMTVSLE